VTTGAVKHAKLHSNRHQQLTKTQLSTGRMPVLSTNQQCQSTEGKKKQKSRLIVLRKKYRLLLLPQYCLGLNIAVGIAILLIISANNTGLISLALPQMRHK